VEFYGLLVKHSTGRNHFKTLNKVELFHNENVYICDFYVLMDLLPAASINSLVQGLEEDIFVFSLWIWLIS